MGARDDDYNTKGVREFEVELFDGSVDRIFALDEREVRECVGRTIQHFSIKRITEIK